VSTTLKLVLVVAAVTLAGGVLRFQDLGEPKRKYFDEVYYASDGCLYAGYDFRDCDLDTDSERSWVHPPLGKALISWGMNPPGPLPGFGNTPFGWRVSAAAAGTATVGMVAVLAFLLLSRVVWAGAAGLLLATEHLNFVQSRIAMLDIFLAFFVVLGFLFLVADRRRNERPPDPGRPASQVPPADAETASPDTRPTLRLGGTRPLRLLAGASLGAAVAVKWSALFGLAGAAALSVAWSVAAARRLRRGSPAGTGDPSHGFVAEAAGQFLAFVLIPFAVYLVAWMPWLTEHGLDLGEWARHHLAMWDYHATLDVVEENGDLIHPYLSPAWSWLLLARPVAYYWQGDPRCCAEILGIGHPFLFWSALLVLPYLVLAWTVRREWQAGAVVVPVLAQYLPWLFVSRPLFLFYMTPVTPFLALGLTFVLRDVARARFPARRVSPVAAAAVVVVCVGVFAFFWPVLAGDRITYEAWQHRMWIHVPGSWFSWI
jgi:dolichyl-phosphate-mannose-protein mannosyltransferase